MTSSHQHVMSVTTLVGSILDFVVTRETYCELTHAKMSLTLPWQATDLERGVGSEVTLWRKKHLGVRNWKCAVGGV